MTRFRLPPSRTLLYARHGETDWNVESRLQGQRDTPLNSVGRAQARRNGEAVAAWLAAEGRRAAEFDWVASPLTRARSTMEIMREAMGLDPHAYRTDCRLKEINFGAWEGWTINEIAAADPERHAARYRDKWGFEPPAGESYAALSKRIAGWLESVERDTICVAHGAVHRVLRRLLEGLDEADAPNLDVPQDRIYVWRGAAAWI